MLLAVPVCSSPQGQGRRESRLQQASQCLSELIKVAAQTPRNYILDQVASYLIEQPGEAASADWLAP